MYIDAITGSKALVTKVAFETVLLLTGAPKPVFGFQASFFLLQIFFCATKLCFLYMFLLRIEGLSFFFCLGTTGTGVMVSLESREKMKLESRARVKAWQCLDWKNKIKFL